MTVEEKRRQRCTISDIMRYQNISQLAAIMRWAHTDSVKESMKRLEFVSRILSGLNLIGELESKPIQSANWRNAVLHEYYPLMRQYSSMSQKDFEELGVVFEYERDGELRYTRYEKQLLIALIERAIQYPEAEGTTFFRLRWCETSYMQSKVIFIGDEDDEPDLTFCTECEVWHENSFDDHVAMDGASDYWRLCQICQEDYVYCESCETYCHIDDWDCEYDCCCSCADERRREEEEEEEDEEAPEAVDRGFEVEPFSEGDDDEQSVHLAFELEEGCCDDYYEYVHAIESVDSLGWMRTKPGGAHDSFFNFKSDCSIRGRHTVEIVTQPFTMAWLHSHTDTIQQMTRMMSRAFETGEEANAGLHVHVDGDFFEDETLYKLGRFIYENYDFIVKLSGRVRYRIDKWAKKDEAHGEDIADTLRVWKQHCDNDRYHAMNLSSLKRHNTVEFRFFNGTNDHTILKARLEIIHAMIHLADAWKSARALISPLNLLQYMVKHGYSKCAVTEVRNAL